MARRRFQQGTVFLRGKRRKVWIGRWREDVLENQCVRRVQRKEILAPLTECPTKRLAQRLLAERLAVVNSPQYRARPTALFSEFAERWEKTVLPQYKASTRPTMKGHIHVYILPFFGAYRLQQIHAEDVQRFAASIARSPRTRQNVIATLRALWESATAWGYVSHSPFAGLKLHSPEPRPKILLSIEDAQRLVVVAAEPLRTIIWLAAETGLRAGEIFGLRIQDFDYGHRSLSVRQSVWSGRRQEPKSKNAHRVVLISSGLAMHLLAFLSTHNGTSDFVFHSRQGTPMNYRNTLRRKLHPLLASLKLPRCGFHAFRHLQASQMDAQSLPLRVRQERLGHSDPRLTLGTYTHVVGAEEMAFAERMGKLLCPKSPPLLRPNAPKLLPAASVST